MPFIIMGHGIWFLYLIVNRLLDVNECIPRSSHNGSVKSMKAHLVAKGYTQVYGIDYEETSNISSIRVLISLAAYFIGHYFS